MSTNEVDHLVPARQRLGDPERVAPVGLHARGGDHAQLGRVERPRARGLGSKCATGAFPWLPEQGKPSDRLVGPVSRKATCAGSPQRGGAEHEWKDGGTRRLPLRSSIAEPMLIEVSPCAKRGRLRADADDGLRAVMEGSTNSRFVMTAPLSDSDARVARRTGAVVRRDRRRPTEAHRSAASVGTDRRASRDGRRREASEQLRLVRELVTTSAFEKPSMCACHGTGPTSEWKWAAVSSAKMAGFISTPCHGATACHVSYWTTMLPRETGSDANSRGHGALGCVCV
jgi:hypothetical protein